MKDRIPLEILKHRSGRFFALAGFLFARVFSGDSSPHNRESETIPIAIMYFMMKNSDYIMTKVGNREYRAVEWRTGMLWIAIAVQSVTSGRWITSPRPAGGT